MACLLMDVPCRPIHHGYLFIENQFQTIQKQCNRPSVSMPHTRLKGILLCLLPDFIRYFQLYNANIKLNKAIKRCHWPHESITSLVTDVYEPDLTWENFNTSWASVNQGYALLKRLVPALMASQWVKIISTSTAFLRTIIMSKNHSWIINNN